MDNELDVSPSAAPCKPAQNVWPRPLTGFFPLLPALLSSSCCLLQLALNVFSLGCAGFAWLTPYRCAYLRLSLPPPPYVDYVLYCCHPCMRHASLPLARRCSHVCLAMPKSASER